MIEKRVPSEANGTGMFQEGFLLRTNVELRGLRWAVVEASPMGDQTLLRLRGTTRQGDRAMAVACFDRLYALIETFEDGDSIVFAHELGSWMIPVREEVWVADKLASLATSSTPNEYATKACPLIRRDSGHSFDAHTYQSALKQGTGDAPEGEDHAAATPDWTRETQLGRSLMVLSLGDDVIFDGPALPEAFVRYGLEKHFRATLPVAVRRARHRSGLCAQICEASYFCTVGTP